MSIESFDLSGTVFLYPHNWIYLVKCILLSLSFLDYPAHQMSDSSSCNIGHWFSLPSQDQNYSRTWRV